MGSCEERKYEVKHSPILGRYIVASRDLQPREVVLKEEPLVEGPNDEDDGTLLCLSCCQILSGEAAFSCRCSKCSFPVCDEDCEKASMHAENECRIFQRSHFRFPPRNTKPVLYKSIIILRSLLLKERNPGKWRELMTMYDGLEVRSNNPRCVVLDERIMENMKLYLPELEAFKPEDVIRISGILDMNAHSCPLKLDGMVVGYKLQLYCQTSLICHSCAPNAFWKGDDEASESSSTIVTRTNVAIKKGEMITTAYATDISLMYGTYRRLLCIEKSGTGSMFVCKCERCMDPTELGTFLSAIKCQSCQTGYLLPLNPTNMFSDWKCNSDDCNNIVDESVIAELLDDVEDEVDFPKLLSPHINLQNLISECDFNGDAEQGVIPCNPCSFDTKTNEDEDADVIDCVKDLKATAMKFSENLLHPNHYIIQELNMQIVRSMFVTGLKVVGKEELQDYIERCDKLLKIVDVISPGFSVYRVFILWLYLNGLLEQWRRRGGEDKGTTDQNPPDVICSMSRQILEYKVLDVEKSQKWVQLFKDIAN